MKAITIDQAFTEELHRTLKHLYEPAELRRSHLLSVFGLDKRVDSASALRALLLDTILSLKPDPKAPRDSSGWRIFQVLTYRFVDQSSQNDVSIELALSVRQLRRLEKAAVQALAEILAARYEIQAPSTTIQEENSPERETASPNLLDPGLSQDELARLKQTYPVEAVDPCELLGNLVATVEPLAQANRVHMDCTIPPLSQPISGQVMTMRQAILTILTAAVTLAPGAEISISADITLNGYDILVKTFPIRNIPPSQSSGILRNLEQANNLLALSGSFLSLLTDLEKDDEFAVRITLAIAGQFGVLVVDDHLDTLQLFERYLSGSIFRFIGTADPTRVFEIAQVEKPSVVVLDVMMPGIDGWELMGRLREHPSTHNIPVIVCSIMQQEALSLALGAARFLAKPFNRETFQENLYQLVRPQEPKPG
jgi:CheY-like chemotaxis protein